MPLRYRMMRTTASPWLKRQRPRPMLGTRCSADHDDGWSRAAQSRRETPIVPAVTSLRPLLRRWFSRISAPMRPPAILRFRPGAPRHGKPSYGREGETRLTHQGRGRAWRTARRQAHVQRGQHASRGKESTAWRAIMARVTGVFVHAETPSWKACRRISPWHVPVDFPASATPRLITSLPHHVAAP